MKKFTLLVAALAISLVTFAQGTITYNLNGGVTNDYGWKNKGDMFAAFMTDNGATEFETLDYYKAQTDPLGSPNICAKLSTCVAMLNDTAKWGWLKIYIQGVHTAQAADGASALDETCASAAWRYAAGAFFVDGRRASWPKSADFSVAGLIEAFQPTWKHGFCGPTTYAEGEIVDQAGSSALGGGETQIVGNEVIKDLRKLQEDDDVKAVVLRVNSPGGSAFASEQIWHAVTELKAKKPVIVSMGDYAASGGYYISCAANCIVAQPTTLTGSIGIFGMFPNAEELLTDKLDLHFDMVKTHSFADMGDLTRPLNNAEKNAIQDHVNRGYQLFLKRCADGRDMDMESLEKIAEGRVWTGSDAKRLGLVDELGGLDKALSIAAQEAGLFAYDTIHLPLKDDLFTVLMNEFQQGYIGSKFLESLGNHYDYARFLRGLKHADRIQARMPFDLHIQ